MSVVILGGGIIGLSIAYYTSLAQPDRKIIIVDSEKSLFLSASGFSGGYVVRDWFSPNVLPLSELSYRLHRELAESNDGRNGWGYSESNAYSLVMDEVDADGKGKTVRGEDWLLTGTSRAEVAKRYTSVVGRSTGEDKTKDELGQCAGRREVGEDLQSFWLCSGRTSTTV
jgi:glycine/D-amino acid oxidase-like deaminating enzyme